MVWSDWRPCMRGMQAGCERMDGETTQFKGYTIKRIGTENRPSPFGSPARVRVYYITDRDGNGVAKAWGMTEARALINADIKGEL